MNSNQYKVLMQHKKTMSIIIFQKICSFDFIKWKILLFFWNHLKWDWTQNDLQFLLNNSKPFEILGDTINMSSKFVQNFSLIDNDHKELSIQKK
jgi:hypothetical protein